MAAEPRNVAIELVLNLPKLDLSVTVAVLQLERAMSRDAARVVFLVESSASEEVSSGEELPGQSNSGALSSRQRTTTSSAAT